MILTEETHIGSNQATMETARATGEEAVFGQSGSGNEVAATRFAVSAIPGQGWQHPDIGSQVSRLGALAAGKIGPNALLKVMSGDEISSFVQYYYKDPVTNGTGNNLLSDVLGSLIQAISGSAVAAPGVKDGATGINTNLNSSLPFGSAVAPDAGNPNGNNPKAYLNILFFNERFEFVAEGSTAMRVQQAGNGGAPLTLLNIKAPKNGYCYVYLSNESSEPVYFDNFKVTHNRGRIIEEDHYYAYGLKIAAISSQKVGDAREGHLDNKYQYQGAFSEMDEDIGLNDFALRNYDAQIGRWVQQDPYQEYPSPYTGMGNDPVNNVDPSGGSVFEGLTAVGKAAVTTLGGAIIGMAVDVLSGGDGGKGALIGAAIGAGAGGIHILTATNVAIQAVNVATSMINTPANSQQSGNVGDIGPDYIYDPKIQSFSIVSNGTNSIYMVVNGTKIPIADVSLDSKSNRQSVADYLWYFAKSVGISIYSSGGEGTFGLMEKPGGDQSNRIPAFTIGLQVWVNKNGGSISKDFNKVFSARTLLRHEKFHQDEHRQKLMENVYTHAALYLRQMLEDDFKKSGEGFQLSIIYSFVQYVANAMEKPIMSANKLIEDFNNNNGLGYRIEINHLTYEGAIYKNNKLLAPVKYREIKE